MDQIPELRSSNYSQYYGNKSYNQKNMNNSSGMISQESDGPSDNEDDSDNVQNASHIDCFKVIAYIKQL